MGGGNGVFFIDGLGWVGSGIFKCQWVGLGWVEGVMGWVGLRKLDPWPCLQKHTRTVNVKSLGSLAERRPIYVVHVTM